LKKGTIVVKTLLKSVLTGCLAFLVVCGIAQVASAQSRTLRIVEYNIDADQSQSGSQYALPQPGLITPYNSTIPYTTSNLISGGVLEGIGEEIINGDPAQPIDILALNETTSNSQTVQPIVNGLNAFYAYYTNPAGYAMSPYQATQDGSLTSGNGPNAMVYNTNTLQLVASVGVGTPTGNIYYGGNGEYRQVVRYEFAPAGVTPGTNNEFYIYVSHYKASSGISNEVNRLGEATIIRNDEANNLPANARVLYVGDYNPDNNSGEPAYQTICSNSAPNGVKQGQGVDPLNILWGPYTDASTTIDWSDSTTSTQILFMLSEESYELRYRDDLQVMTSNVYYDVAGGLQYVPGTYHSFGNNTTTPWGSSVNSGSNTALNDLDPTLTSRYNLPASTILQDLTTATDHLPIVADYTIPVSLSLPTFTTSQANETCNGQSIGSITVTASGGSGSGYTYSDDNGSSFQASNMFTGLAPGSYTVVVKDGSGNNSTGQVVTITQPSAVTFTTSQVNEPCYGQSVGSITVTASGGSGSGYTYSDDNGSSFQASNMFTGLAPGIYQIVVQDGAGCLSSATPVTITQPSALSCSVNPSMATNCVGNSQVFTANVSGGTAGYTYSWSGPNSFSATGSSITVNNLQPASAGTYTVTVTDANGCGTAGAATLAINPAPASPTAANNGPVLAGMTLDLTASTVDGTTYSWTGPNGFTSTNQNLSILNAPAAASGTYVVTVTDSNGCTAAGSTTAVVMAMRITSITTQSNNVYLTWLTFGGTTNIVQVTPGNPGYNTNFSDISNSLTIVGGSGLTNANYEDAGGATNSPSQFYRVRSVP
jgi:hypothetical protein